MNFGGSKSSSSIVRSIISPKSRFLDVVGLKACVPGSGSVFEDTKGCGAVIGKDCELVICGR